MPMSVRPIMLRLSKSKVSLARGFRVTATALGRCLEMGLVVGLHGCHDRMEGDIRGVLPELFRGLQVRFACAR